MVKLIFKMEICLVFIFICILTVCADQPVKCPKGGDGMNYIDGTWTFYVNPEPQILDLYKQRDVCTHNLPNSIQIIGQEYKFNMEKHEKWQVKIVNGDKVQATKIGTQTSFEGDWDILYD